MEVCNYLKRKLDVDYDYNGEVMITVGGSEAIDIAMRAMLDPGDEVLIPQPSYVSYVPCVELTHAVPVIIELKEENEFRLTKEEVLEKITDKTKILVLPFPNNPTGSIMERKDLEDIAQVCIEKDIFVLSDEIYSELSYKEEHVSIACIPGMKERTVLINGFSKAYAMTGWRLGYACVHQRLLWIRWLKSISLQLCVHLQQASMQRVEALRNGDDDVARMKESYNQRRNYLVHELRDMGLDCFEPYGAFYVFPSIKKFGLTSEEFATRLLEEEKVAVVPGTAFGDCGEGFLRISYAYSLDDLKLALGRVRKFVERLDQK